MKRISSRTTVTCLFKSLSLVLILLLVVAFDYAQGNKANSPQASAILAPYFIRNMGTSDPADANKAKYLFDYPYAVDPKNGTTSFPADQRGDLTQGIVAKQYSTYYPSEAENYPGQRGARIILDMTGLKDFNNVSNNVTITDVYGGGVSYENVADTLYFYNLDPMFSAPFEDREKYMARPDVYLTPFAKLATKDGGTYKFSNISGLNISCRYVMLRWLLKDRGAFRTTPNFSHLIIYGTRNYDVNSITLCPTTYNGPRPSKARADRTFDKLNGTNLMQGQDTNQTSNESHIRLYGLLPYWDESNTPIATNLKRDRFLDIGPYQYPIYRRRDQKQFWSVRGTSKWIESQFAAHGKTASYNVDEYMDDPELRTSWDRSSGFFKQFALLHGSVNIPSLSRWADTGKMGNNWDMGVENGNEDEFKGMTVLAYFAKTSREYDSIKSIDPNYKMIQSGMVYADSGRVSNLVWLSKILRADGKLPLDILNFHEYLGTTSKLHKAPDYAEQIGASMESAEKGEWRKLIQNTVDAFWGSVQDTIPVWATEWGQGGFDRPAKTEQEASYIWDMYNTPPFGIYTNLEAKAIHMARKRLLCAFTDLEANLDYAFSNSDFGPITFGLFQGYGKTTGRNTANFEATVFYPDYYYQKCLYNSLKGWYPAKIISGASINAIDTGLQVLQFRKLEQKDSVAYVVWAGTYRGSSLPNQSIPIGSITGDFKKIQPLFNTIIPTESTISPSGQNLVITAEENPALYFGKEGPPSNGAPIANAGADIFIRLPTNSTALDGTNSYNPAGGDLTYQWSKISGPTSYTITGGSTATPTISTLTEGAYQIRLLVTNNLGKTAADTVLVTVSPAPTAFPIADAGPDQTIVLPTSQTNLTALASYNPDGGDLTYIWTKISGPASFSIYPHNSVTPVINGLTEGTYEMKVVVTNSIGKTAEDIVLIHVVSSTTVIPTANAGPDQTITLPTNTANLDGTASSNPGGGTLTYAWVKVSGPAPFTITGANTAKPSIGALTEGTYEIKLTVTNSSGKSSDDIVLITVKPENIIIPTANAGPDQTITLPTNTANLDGTVSSNPGGGTLTYAWVKVSGPSSFTITGANTAKPSIGALTEGTYEIKLTVTNSQGRSDEDNVIITVVKSSLLPVANAGVDTIINFPGGEAILSGKASYAQGGNILLIFKWKQISGPTKAVIANANSSETIARNLEPGEYVFELEVTDNNGKTASDRKKVIVINKFFAFKQIRVYPNPFKNSLTVRLIGDITGTMQARIRCVTGVVAFTKKVEKNQQFAQFNLDLSGLPNGVYILQMVQKNKVEFLTTIIKQ